MATRASKQPSASITSLIEDIRNGDGVVVKPGSIIRCHYEGKLNDGTSRVFDTSRGKEPFVFVLGEGQVIQGWDLGLLALGKDGAAMKEGGIRRLLIPPELAYGSKGIRDPQDRQKFIIPPD